MVITIAEKLDRPEDQCRLIFVMMLAQIAGLGLNYVVPRVPLYRYIYSITLGVLLQMFMFREAVWHIYLMAYVCYALMAFLPKE